MDLPIMDSRRYLQDTRPSADSRRKLADFESTIRACRPPTIHICQLHDAASKRARNRDPFLAAWKRNFPRHAVRKRIVRWRPPCTSSRGPNRQLDECDDNDSAAAGKKVEEWKECFDGAVDAMSCWALEQQEVLATDRVKKFVAGEAALVAAGASY